VNDFAGFPVSALDFYDDLEMDNTRSFWEQHKATYDRDVRAPMQALVAALEPEFATAGLRVKVFRPHRDVRFAKDKTPYKTHQGAFVPAGESTGWYVEISARGTRVGAGYYEASGPRLAAVREAVAHDRFGPQLETIVADLEAEGFEISGEKLKTSPRGYDADHPRIELLRHKQLMAGRRYGFEAEDIGPGLLERVRDDWRALRPLVEWVAEHART
jgi:uncharacterized protein (TIGR02453 family)